MSNPHNHALSLASKKSMRSGMRVAHIGMNSQPVNIAGMSSVNSHSWKKSVSFEYLKCNIYPLASAYTVADLISIVSNELPQDTGAAFQEAQSTARSVNGNILLVGNLETLAFLISTGNVTNIEDASRLKSILDTISFLRLNCVVDGEAFDNRVTKDNPM